MAKEEKKDQGGDYVPKEGTEGDPNAPPEEGQQNAQEAGKEPTAIEQAEKLHAQIKSENDRREALLKREEELHAEKMLGGHSNAGQTPQKKEKLTDEQYKDKVMAGEVPEKDE